MPLPPQMSPEERARALDLAKAARRERASVKARLSGGEISINHFFELADLNSVLAKMRVVELLESLPGYGKIRAQSIMERLS